MALLRLAMFAALVGCTSADAQTPAVETSPAFSPPAAWSKLPAMTTAITDAAKAGGATVRTAEAWGDTSRGCYAVSIALSGGGVTSDMVLGGLAGIPEVGKGAQFTITDVRRPEQNNGALEARFARPGYSGRVRVRFNNAGLDAVACFANDREPVGCEAACTQLLQGPT